MTHGLRSTYKAGCVCLPCRAAEATYRAGVRAQHRQGRPPLGSRISAVEARRLIRSLQAEGFTRRQMAQQAYGERSHNVLTVRSAVTVRRLLQIRRLARLKLSEDRGHNQENV